MVLSASWRGTLGVVDGRGGCVDEPHPDLVRLEEVCGRLDDVGIDFAWWDEVGTKLDCAGIGLP